MFARLAIKIIYITQNIWFRWHFEDNQSQYYTFLYYVSLQTIFVQYCTDDFIESLLLKLSQN